MNRVQLIGHLGQAVELKHLEGAGPRGLENPWSSV